MSKRIDSRLDQSLSIGQATAENGRITGIENALIQGDLSSLSAAERIQYYLKVCESVGLNPATKPFDYVKLSGKEVLYATKAAAEQLRASRGVSVTIKSRETVGDCYVVTASAALPDGRVDESIGAVAIGTMKGDALCNALMKAETKAKRRVTLSICGLGMLDETELETIKGAVTAPATPEIASKPVAASLPNPSPVTQAVPVLESVELDVPDFDSTTSEAVNPEFEIVLISGPYQGKKIKELSKEEAGFYYDEMTSKLAAINRPASTLRGDHRAMYYAIQNYVFGDKK